MLAVTLAIALRGLDLPFGAHPSIQEVHALAFPRKPPSIRVIGTSTLATTASTSQTDRVIILERLLCEKSTLLFTTYIVDAKHA